MLYFAFVTIEAEESEPRQYERVARRLESLGLRKQVSVEDGRRAALPSNTYTGAFQGVSDAEVANDLRDRVKKALSLCNVRGRLFVAIGGQWSWRVSKVG